MSFYDAITGASAMTGALFQVSPVNTFILCVGMRVLMGVCVGLIFNGLKRLDKSRTWSYIVSAMCAPALNTLFFMGWIVVIFPSSCIGWRTAEKGRNGHGEKKRFAVIGSDARQLAAGRALARAGYAVGGAEQVARADCILLPLPLDAARTPLAELLRAARPGTLALGGMLSEEGKGHCSGSGVELVDYFAREELTIRNAIPTAEGCIGILLAQRKRTLWGARSCCWALARWGRRWGYGWRHWGRM